MTLNIFTIFISDLHLFSSDFRLYVFCSVVYQVVLLCILEVAIFYHTFVMHKRYKKFYQFVICLLFLLIMFP